VQLGLMLSLQDGVLVTVSTMVNGMKKCKHTPHLCLILRPERRGFIFIFCGLLLSVGPTLPLYYITECPIF
jgi:hypothetical protein